jgi:replication factor C subunit 2/4
MRQAVNNLQSTYSGFNFVGAEEVFKVCDQPHPVKVQVLIKSCVKGDIDEAMAKLEELWVQGYAAVDIVSTLFRVVKGMDALAEYIKLEFIKVSLRSLVLTSRELLADFWSFLLARRRSASLTCASSRE